MQLNILTILLLFTTAAATDPPYNITIIENGSGLYYENISPLILTNSDWELLTHIDLQNYNQIFLSIIATFNKTEKLCSSIDHEKLGLRQCQTFVNVIKNSLNKLQKDRTLVQNLLYSTHSEPRPKRGLVNIIGRTSKYLFGTLDDKDAEFYDQSLKLLKSDQNHVLELAKQQTSVFENAITAINETFINDFKCYKSLENKIKSITEYLNKSADNINANTMHTEFIQNFEENIILFDLLLNQFTSYQSNLVQILLSAQNGQIHPYVINPAVLTDQLLTIQQYLSKDLSFPVMLSKENAHELYKIISVSAYYYSDRLNFKISIPLVSPTIYELYKVYSLFVHVKDNFYSFVIPEYAYLAMDDIRQYHFYLNENKIRACFYVSNKYLCKAKEPVYLTQAQIAKLCYYPLRITYKILAIKE